MIGSSYAKSLLRSSAILNIPNDGKYCLLRAILAKKRLSNISHRNRVSNYRQYFNELNIEGFGFTIGFKCIDVHKFEKLKSLSNNLFELKFHQDQNRWRHKLIPIQISKTDKDIFVYLFI